MSTPQSGPVNYVICSGWLHKRGGFVTAWKRRYFVLRNDNFLCYFSAEINASTPISTIERTLLGIIPLSEALAVGDSTSAADINSPSNESVFDIVTVTRTYVCRASSADSKNKWIEALRNRITPVPEFPFSKQGFLYKKGTFKWTRHYMAIGKHCIFIFEDERQCAAFQRIASHSGAMFSLAMERHCQAAISLMSAQVSVSAPGDDVDGMFHVFHVSATRTKTWLSAASHKEVKRWTDEINQEILTRQIY